MLGGSVVLDLDLEVEPLLLGERPERPLGVVAHLAEAARPRVHVHPARLDLGQVEDVVDQVEQVAARAVDRARELDLLVGEVLVRVVARAASRGSAAS